MDTKITLAFDEKIILKAKKYAEKNNTSVSRLVEMILDKITHTSYQSLEDMPIADWVNTLSEGETRYNRKPKTNKELKAEYHNRKK